MLFGVCFNVHRWRVEGDQVFRQINTFRGHATRFPYFCSHKYFKLLSKSYKAMPANLQSISSTSIGGNGNLKYYTTIFCLNLTCNLPLSNGMTSAVSSIHFYPYKIPHITTYQHPYFPFTSILVTTSTEAINHTTRHESGQKSNCLNNIWVPVELDQTYGGLGACSTEIFF